MTKLNAIDFFDYLQENVSNNDKEEVITNKVNNFFTAFTDEELTDCNDNILFEYDFIAYGKINPCSNELVYDITGHDIDEYHDIQKPLIVSKLDKHDKEIALNYCKANALREIFDERRKLIIIIAIYNYICVPIYRFISVEIEEKLNKILKVAKDHVYKEIDKLQHFEISLYVNAFLRDEIKDIAPSLINDSLEYETCQDLYLLLWKLEENKSKYNVKNT